MIVLGISSAPRDSAAVVLRDGEIVAASEEERFTRRKHQGGFPIRAVAFCLAEAGVGLGGVDRIAVCGETLPKDLAGLGARAETVAPHLSQAAAAFYPAPFDAAAVLVLDGADGRVATALWRGGAGALAPVWEAAGPDSLGLLYSAFTAYLGFRPRSGEYKVMGLAPYGEPRHARTILDRLAAVDAEGRFRLDRTVFSDADPARAAERLADLFGVPRRAPEDDLAQAHFDLAASIQVATETVVLCLARAARRETGLRRLCLGGEVALNCVANGAVLREGGFEDLWIQPAAGPAGGALGAALAVWHRDHPRAGGGDRMRGARLGPGFAQDEIAARLTTAGARFDVLDEAALLAACARELAVGGVLGWFQGRAEFGPRALGCRSILVDPRVATLRATLNAAVKFREPFRPFAPAVLREDAAAWFDLDRESPYMLLTAPVARADIPAATHVDGSARVQTVGAEAEPRFRALLEAFKRETGCPVLVNTSFNIRGEPIVGTPEEAFRCFMGSGIDALAIGDCFLRKAEQDTRRAADYRHTVEPD